MLFNIRDQGKIKFYIWPNANVKATNVNAKVAELVVSLKVTYKCKF